DGDVEHGGFLFGVKGRSAVYPPGQARLGEAGLLGGGGKPAGGELPPETSGVPPAQPPPDPPRPPPPPPGPRGPPPPPPGQPLPRRALPRRGGLLQRRQQQRLGLLDVLLDVLPRLPAHREVVAVEVRDEAPEPPGLGRRLPRCPQPAHGLVAQRGQVPDGG